MPDFPTWHRLVLSNVKLLHAAPGMPACPQLRNFAVLMFRRPNLEPRHEPLRADSQLLPSRRQSRTLRHIFTGNKLVRRHKRVLQRARCLPPQPRLHNGRLLLQRGLQLVRALIEVRANSLLLRDRRRLRHLPDVPAKHRLVCCHQQLLQHPELPVRLRLRFRSLHVSDRSDLVQRTKNMRRPERLLRDCRRLR